MILVIGGAGSGKHAFVKSLGYEEKDMADGIMDERPVLLHLERMVFAQPEQASERLLAPLLRKKAVVCDEVGRGIIPVDRQERLGREETGRLCIKLAQEAEAVVRLVCGIPVYIKGAPAL